MLGHGATRDFDFTNASVQAFVLVLQAVEGQPPRRHLTWLPGFVLGTYTWRRVQLAVVDSALSLWVDGAPLLAGHVLPSWRPLSRWSIGLHGARDAPHHYHWVDNFQAASGAFRTRAEVPVLLSRNGQQFEEGAAHNFVYYAPPAVSSLSPHAGPVRMNSSIVVHGAYFGGGASYACFFGDASVFATFNATDGSIRCIAPPINISNTSSLTLPMRVSLNGVDAPASVEDLALSLPFVYYAATPALATPNSGPTEGDFEVRVSGSGILHGHNPLCRFGSMVVLGSHLRAEEMILCLAPAAVLEGRVPLAISLNGQDFDDAALHVDYYVSPVGSSISPIAGPSAGGTLVTVHGAGFGAVTPSTRCRFGQAVVEGQNVTGEIVCAAPSAAAARAADDFGAENCTANGDAILETGDGHALLRLVAGGAFDQEGWAVCKGSGVHWNGASYFEASFELQLSSGGEGFSISYGRLDDGGLGEHGSSMGLRVMLDTRPPQRVVVTYADELLNDTAVNLSNLAHDFVPIVLVHDLNSHGGLEAALTLVINDTAVLRGLPIPHWSSQPDWSFGFGARSGSGQANCTMRSLRLRAGSLVTPLFVPFAVSRNGQDFVRETFADFKYYATPTISSVIPRSGPAAGGTKVLVAGEGLVGGSAYECRMGGVASSPDVNTTTAAPYVHCTMPQGTSGTATFDVSLNGQDALNFDFTLYPVPSVVSIQPSSGPAAGGTLVELNGSFSSLGTQPICRFGSRLYARSHGTLSVLTQADGASGVNGASALATHGLAANEVHASVVNGTLALCTSPPGVEHSVVTLEISLNGHDFTTAALSYQYYANVPALTRVVPVSDSLAGNRVISISGSGLANGSDYKCRYSSGVGSVSLGDSSVYAATEVGDRAVACTSPSLVGLPALALPHDSRLNLTLQVALNGQQYTATTLNFTAVTQLAPTLFGVWPASGPELGGTEVLVSGLRMQFGSQYLCRFATSLVNASFDADAGAVRCFSPPTSAAAVQLALTFNGVHFENTSLGFTFHQEVSLAAVSPTSGPVSHVQCSEHACPGGSNLGTRVTLSGNHFDGVGTGAAPQCGFNGTRVPASIASANSASCHAPSSMPPGVAELRLSLNGRDLSAASLSYRFLPVAAISSVQPQVGPADGGTQIVVLGSGLADGSHCLCRFGGRTVQGSCESGSDGGSGSVRCVAPSWSDATAGAGYRFELHRAPFELSVNGQEFSATGTIFVYHHDPMLSSATPTSGPRAGGSLVALRGSRLDGGDASLRGLWVSQISDVRDGSSYRCRFDGRGGELAITNSSNVTLDEVNFTLGGASLPLVDVAATWQPANDRVVCMVPPLANADAGAAAKVAISLSINGADFTRSAALYEYTPMPELSSLAPAIGPSLGGETVTVSGSGFSSALGMSCRFGDATTVATVSRASELRCKTPLLSSATRTALRPPAIPLSDLATEGAAAVREQSLVLSL